MLGFFDSVKSFLNVGSVKIDTKSFHLHCKITAAVLLGFSLVITSGAYIGDPIDCIVDKPVDSVIDTFCWIHSTYTIPDKYNNRSGLVPHPGVSGHDPRIDTPKFHKYYQWVCFVLFFQALAFYMPRYIWKIREGGRIKMIVKEAGYQILIADEEEKEANREKVLNYFRTNLNNHNGYAYAFFLCEILCFINVVVQIYITDMFVGYTFTTYGSRALSFLSESPMNRTDPMDEAFPKVTKCTLSVYGPSGNIIPYDALCVLPQNIANEKIYYFLWFWYIFVAVICGCSLIIRIGSFLPGVRLGLLKANVRKNELLHDIDQLRSLPIGDWFLLYQLRNNIDAITYTDLVDYFAKEYEIWDIDDDTA